MIANEGGDMETGHLDIYDPLDKYKGMSAEEIYDDLLKQAGIPPE